LRRREAVGPRASVEQSRLGLIVAMAELATRAVEHGYSREQWIRSEVSRAMERVPFNVQKFIEGIPQL